MIDKSGRSCSCYSENRTKKLEVGKKASVNIRSLHHVSALTYVYVLSSQIIGYNTIRWRINALGAGNEGVW